jgi:hypothetical protein
MFRLYIDYYILGAFILEENHCIYMRTVAKRKLGAISDLFRYNNAKASVLWEGEGGYFATYGNMDFGIRCLGC